MDLPDIIFNIFGQLAAVLKDDITSKVAALDDEFTFDPSFSYNIFINESPVSHLDKICIMLSAARRQILNFAFTNKTCWNVYKNRIRIIESDKCIIEMDGCSFYSSSMLPYSTHNIRFCLLPSILSPLEPPIFVTCEIDFYRYDYKRYKIERLLDVMITLPRCDIISIRVDRLAEEIRATIVGGDDWRKMVVCSSFHELIDTIFNQQPSENLSKNIEEFRKNISKDNTSKIFDIISTWVNVKCSGFSYDAPEFKLNKLMR